MRAAAMLLCCLLAAQSSICAAYKGGRQLHQRRSPPPPQGPIVIAAAPRNPPPPPVAGCTVGNGYRRMFPSLAPTAFTEANLTSLGNAILHPVVPVGAPVEPVAAILPNGRALLPDENKDMFAAYTYMGQFIDHDITRDPRPNDLTTPVDVNTLVNARTPQFDLDSVFGGGPTANPELYDADGIHLKIGAALTTAVKVRNGTLLNQAGHSDHPRDAVSGQAILGDPRDDENRITASLHTFWVRYYNKYVDVLLAAATTPSTVHAKARRQVVLTYQYVVLTDFLPTIVGKARVDSVLTRTSSAYITNLKWYSPCLQMPVEFAGAAYRWGHSAVRDDYKINDDPTINADPIDIVALNRLPIFAGLPPVPGTDLGGFYPSPSNFGIDWDYFLPKKPEGDVDQNGFGRFAQFAYKMDLSIAQGLGLLPAGAAGSGPINLAVRNLLRGQQLGLPCGQDVARAMGFTPLRDDQIMIGEATTLPQALNPTFPITNVSPAFAGCAPLWTYVLAEAANEAFNIVDGQVVPDPTGIGGQKAPNRLGPVAGTIVAETFVGILKADKTSILYNPTFKPLCSLKARSGVCATFGLREFFDSVQPPAAENFVG